MSEESPDLIDQVVKAASDRVKTAKNNAEAQAARRTEAISLRLAGMSYEAIGERLGVTANAVYQMIDRSLQRAEAQGVSLLRAEENARLDRAQMAIWGKVITGDFKAIALFLQISNHRAKINGLFAPTQVQVSMTIRQEMEDALSHLESLVLHESPPQQAQPYDATPKPEHGSTAAQLSQLAEGISRG